MRIGSETGRSTTVRNPAEFKERTVELGLRVIEAVAAWPPSIKGRTIGNLLCRSGSSVGASYRAACRAKSTADFIDKTGMVEEEADEPAFWLERVVHAKPLPATRLAPLIAEANEILALVVSSIPTAKRKGR
jgi:four helix bundle protein